MKKKYLSVLLLVLAAVLVSAIHAPRGPLKPPVYPLTEKSAELLGTKIVYVEGGQGEPVIFIHGVGGALLDWEKVLPYFAARYDTIALDQPGFGKSEKRTNYLYLIANNAAVVAALMDAEKIGKAYIVGNSMGGEVAAYFAIHYPERVEKLVLVDAAGALNTPYMPVLNEIVWMLAPWIDSMSNRGGSNDPHTDDPDRVKPNIAQAIYHSDEWWGCRRAWSNEIYDIFTLDLKQDIHKISAPTLEIWGSKDPLLAEYSKWFFWENIPGSELLIIPGGDHTSQLSKPREFEAAVDGFLQGKPNPAYQKRGQKVDLKKL